MKREKRRERRSPRSHPLGQSRMPADSWRSPEPLGYPASIQALGGFAAPLLAAASFTMTAMLLPTLSTTSQSFARWPDVALMLLVGGGLAQIAAVQAAVWARRYDTDPDELLRWWPDHLRDGRPSEWLITVQRSHLEQSERWAGRTRLAYHLGIILLLAGTTVAVVPPGQVMFSRWLLVGICALGLAGELLWVVAALFVDPSRRRLAIAHTAVLLVSILTLLLAVSANAVPALVTVLAGSCVLAAAQLRWAARVIGAGGGTAGPAPDFPYGPRAALVCAVLGVGAVIAALLLVLAGQSPWLRSVLGLGAVVCSLAEGGQLRWLLKAERTPT